MGRLSVLRQHLWPKTKTLGPSWRLALGLRLKGRWTSELRLPLALRLLVTFAGAWLGSVLLLRAILGASLEQAQTRQAVGSLSRNIILSELALERYPPEAVSRLGGLSLVVARSPLGAQPQVDRHLAQQAATLGRLLCKPLERCPEVLAISQPQRGVWIRLQSSLEPVWLFYPLPLPGLVSRDPLTLSISLIGAGVVAAALFLTFEVQRPMRRLVKAMATVGTTKGGLAEAGSPGESRLQIDGALEVRRLTDHFNAMLARLQAGDRERQTMLAGIAHDLNSPITRLRLRLGDRAPLNLDGAALAKMASDLDALERITRQFLLFAGSGSKEPFVEVPLDALLEELSGRYDEGLIELELEPVTAAVQPVALGRAIANLIDNAIAYGLPPVRLQLLCKPVGHFLIHVVDGGEGIPEHLFGKAIEPFQRLDPARRGEGHCGLGLAIAQRIAHQHGGRLELTRPPGCGGLGLCVSFSGRCQPLDGAQAAAPGGD
jgi:two-component system osmolarity sensor histidine kinase EnvZ